MKYKLSLGLSTLSSTGYVPLVPDMTHTVRFITLSWTYVYFTPNEFENLFCLHIQFMYTSTDCSKCKENNNPMLATSQSQRRHSDIFSSSKVYFNYNTLYWEKVCPHDQIPIKGLFKRKTLPWIQHVVIIPKHFNRFRLIFCFRYSKNGILNTTYHNSVWW